MLRLKLLMVAVLAATLSGCMSDGNGLDASLGGGGLGSLGSGLDLGGGGGLGTPALPSTEAYVKAQLERRGI